MKKIITYLSAAFVLALAASSCQKEENFVAQSSEKTMSITASVEDASKTALSGLNVLWNAGDKISVLYGTENKEFTTAQSGASVSFSGEAAPEAGQAVWAVYPYSTANTLLGEDSLRVTIPEIQYAVAGSFAPNANVTVGKIVDNTVTMYNVGALIKLPIAGSDITSVSIRAKYDANNTVIPVAGIFNVKFSGTAPVATGYRTSHIVKLLPPVGESVFAAGDYYIAVSAVSMAQGFDIIYTKAAARGVKSTSNSCTIQRAHILPIPAQDGSVNFVTGRFVEFSAIDASDKSVQPFTKDLMWGSNSKVGDQGLYYQKGDEEYMYQLLSSGADTTGFYLGSGTGKVGINPTGTSTCYFGLPYFVHKKLSVVEVHSGISTRTENYDYKPLIGKSTSVYLRKGTSTSSSDIQKITAPWDGYWWPATSSTWAFGECYNEFIVNNPEENTMYSISEVVIRKISMFYEGDDVEEVISVKAEAPTSILKDDLPATINGSFKSWNFGQGGATYVAGLDYKLAGASDWTSVTGVVTGQTFTAELPNTLEVADYVIRPWAGVDGAEGAKLYGAESKVAITGEVTEKTLTYNFLVGDPSTWNSSSTTAAQWPFTGTQPKDEDVRGTTVQLTDAAGNILVADFTGITNKSRTFNYNLTKGRGLRIRNYESVQPGETINFNEPFQLHLPKFEGLKLESVKISTFFTSADNITIVDGNGTVLNGGASGKPSGTGVGNAKTWTLTNTDVNTIYRIKTVPKGDYKNPKSSAAGQGYQFEPAQIVLHYVKPTE